jgi:hypothetical protein
MATRPAREFDAEPGRMKVTIVTQITDKTFVLPVGKALDSNARSRHYRFA